MVRSIVTTKCERCGRARTSYQEDPCPHCERMLSCGRCPRCEETWQVCALTQRCALNRANATSEYGTFLLRNDTPYVGQDTDRAIWEPPITLDCPPRLWSRLWPRYAIGIIAGIGYVLVPTAAAACALVALLATLVAIKRWAPSDVVPIARARLSGASARVPEKR